MNTELLQNLLLSVPRLLIVCLILMSCISAAIIIHHRRLLRVHAQLLHEREQRQSEITIQTMRAQERERNKIGRELHDNVNQLIAVAKLNLSVALHDPKQLDILVHKSIEHLNQATEEIRALSKSLVSPLTNNISLYESVQELVNNVQPCAENMQFMLFMEEMNEARISCDIKLTAYRILQEQLSNILKHAEASVIQIYVTMSAEALLLRVIDNGKGFDMHTIRKGIGISNIFNRTEAYRGKAEFETAPGKGCTLNARLPLSSAHRTLSPLKIYRKLAALW